MKALFRGALGRSIELVVDNHIQLYQPDVRIGKS